MPRLAVFDVDHTITKHSTGRRLLQCGRKAGIFGAGTLITLPYHYVRYRNGTIDVESAALALARLSGRTQGELQALARDCFEQRVSADIMDEARETVEAHIRAGDVVVFATSSLRLIIKPLADLFEVSYVLATELEFEDGVATGRLATAPCYGEEKRDRVVALASALRIELSVTTFYSDSHMDLPLLRAVGSPVAVNPDRKLRKEAAARSWEIVRFR
jgi:HAD superfamily hydrolase (TIGR01490 family)